MSVGREHQRVEGQKIRGFNFIRILGGGSFSVVYEAFDQNTEEIVAVKAIPKSLMVRTPKLNELVNTQIRVLRECKNPNVIRFIDTFNSDKTVFIAMEYCDGGDLEGYLKKMDKNRLKEDEATTFLKQIINGFKGLHQVKAMHRDFKVANILLHQGQCKIADLGFAKQLEQNSVTRTVLGTSLTMAPEILQNKSYGIQADIWSVGVVYYQILYGEYPFRGHTDGQILKKIKFTKPIFDMVKISDKAKNFIERCLVVEPAERINWRQIYDHPLIKQPDMKIDNPMLNNFTSRIRIDDNKNFYNQKLEINEELIYPEIKAQSMKKHPIISQHIEQAQKADLQNIHKINQQKKKIEEEIKKYESLYVRRRNNIMFMFEYIAPYVNSLHTIPVNHAIILFLLCKTSYHQMKNHEKLVSKGENFMKIEPYFKEFSQNNKYNIIKQTAYQDIMLLEAQLISYKQQIGYCSKEIRSQFDYETKYHQKWEQFIKEEINSYIFQLGDNLHRQKDKKNTILKLVQSLEYYKENIGNQDIQKFDEIIKNMNYQTAQVMLKSKLQSFLLG